MARAKRRWPRPLRASTTMRRSHHFGPLLNTAEMPWFWPHDLHHACATIPLVAENKPNAPVAQGTEQRTSNPCEHVREVLSRSDMWPRYAENLTFVEPGILVCPTLS